MLFTHLSSPSFLPRIPRVFRRNKKTPSMRCFARRGRLSRGCSCHSRASTSVNNNVMTHAESSAKFPLTDTRSRVSPRLFLNAPGVFGRWDGKLCCAELACENRGPMPLAKGVLDQQDLGQIVGRQ